MNVFLHWVFFPVSANTSVFGIFNFQKFGSYLLLACSTVVVIIILNASRLVKADGYGCLYSNSNDSASSRGETFYSSFVIVVSRVVSTSSDSPGSFDSTSDCSSPGSFSSVSPVSCSSSSTLTLSSPVFSSLFSSLPST